jgi:hypothetical protein
MEKSSDRAGSATVSFDQRLERVVVRPDTRGKPQGSAEEGVGHVRRAVLERPSAEAAHEGRKVTDVLVRLGPAPARDRVRAERHHLDAHRPRRFGLTDDANLRLVHLLAPS